MHHTKLLRKNDQRGGVGGEERKEKREIAILWLERFTIQNSKSTYVRSKDPDGYYYDDDYYYELLPTTTKVQPWMGHDKVQHNISLTYVCADPAWECGGPRGDQIAARWGKGCPRRA